MLKIRRRETKEWKYTENPKNPDDDIENQN